MSVVMATITKVGNEVVSSSAGGLVLWLVLWVVPGFQAQSHYSSPSNNFVST